MSWSISIIVEVLFTCLPKPAFLNLAKEGVGEWGYKCREGALFICRNFDLSFLTAEYKGGVY